MVVVYLGQSSPVFQIALVMYLALADMLMNFHWNAYESKFADFVAKVNDIVVLLLSYFPFLYCGIIQDTEIIYQVGWVQVGLVAIMFVVNFIVIGITTIIKLIESYRRSKVEQLNLRILRDYGYVSKVVV